MNCISCKGDKQHKRGTACDNIKDCLEDNNILEKYQEFIKAVFNKYGFSDTLAEHIDELALMTYVFRNNH